MIESFYVREKPIGCVCHGPAALLHAKGPDGFPLVKGKRVTGFTNREENWVQLSEVVPFMIEDMLSNKGGLLQQRQCLEAAYRSRRQSGDRPESGLLESWRPRR